jgi:hypothetical protein
VRFPQDTWPPGTELSIVVDTDAQRRGKLNWRLTGERGVKGETLLAPLAAAFDVAAARALASVVPGDARYLVGAKVTLPIVVRHESAERFVVTEQEPLLR